MQTFEATGVTGDVTYAEADLGWDPSRYTRHMVQVTTDGGKTWDLAVRPEVTGTIASPASASISATNASGSTVTVDASYRFDRYDIAYSAAPTGSTVRVWAWNDSDGVRL